jgi:hypothetical protein
MNNDAQAPQGRNVNNPVRKHGGARRLPAFRAGYCLCQAVNPCAARVQDGASCLPELRSASLHLLGVIHVAPLRGLEN